MSARIVLTFSLICLFLIIGRGLFVLNSILNEQDSMKDTLEEISNVMRLQDQRVHMMEELLLRSRGFPYDQNQKVRRKRNLNAAEDPQMPGSCADLQQIGHSLNGFYTIRSSNELRSVFCNFDNPSNAETAIGAIDVKSSPVYFYVLSGTAYGNTGTPIPFQTDVLNIGGGMNLTSGIFTAPTAGIYLFTFSALKNNLNNGVNIYLNVNDILVGSAYGAVTADTFTMAMSSTLKLKVGDQVKLILGSGILYGNAACYTHFNGVLLHEDLFA